MKRNGGTVVDVAGGTVTGRDGRVMTPDRLVVGAGGLYYARPFENNRHVTYIEHWLLPAQGWTISRFRFGPGVAGKPDWYIEPEIIEVKNSLWQVRDTYLDIEVYEGVRYQLEDAEELAAGLAAGEIPLSEGIIALNALGSLCAELRRNGCSGRALLAEFASGLPS